MPTAYTLVSLQSADFAVLGHVAPPAAIAAGEPTTPEPELPPAALLAAHPAWDTGTGWKHQLNNLRLLLQPYVCSCLLLPWLHLLSPPHVQAVQAGFDAQGSLVNTFRLAFPT